MNHLINLVAFGTFGNPNGFRQTFFIFGDKNIAKNVRTFDLKTDAITLFPKSKIYSIRKELANGINAIAYNVYTFAKEQNSDRGGTFIGSSVLYLNKIAEENNTISCLNEFHNNLVQNNVQNDVIVVNHSDKFSVSKPKDFDKLNLHLREVEDLNFGQSSNRNLVVYSQTTPDKLRQLLKKSIDLLNVYDTIYFTENEEVAVYVNKKGIFKLVEVEGFEQEIQKLYEERKQKRQSLISELESEKQQLESDRKRVNNEFKYQMEQNEKLHKENSRRIDESKDELNKVHQKYDVYSKIIDDSVDCLKSDQQPEKVRQLHNENRRRFIDSINQHIQPNFITKIAKPQVKIESKQNIDPVKQRRYEQNFSSDDEYTEIRESKSGVFKLLSVVLFTLWAATLAYFLFFHEQDTVIAEEDPQQNEIQVAEQSIMDTVNTKGLSPNPNAELNENDYRLVAKKIKQSMPVEDIVQIIFNANPTDIKNSYSNQADEYARKIIELNKDCFTQDSNRFIFSKDTIRHIPSLKK